MLFRSTVVQGKCTTPNYKVKKRVYKDESEWVRVGDAHEAIVGRSEFESQEGTFPDACIATNFSLNENGDIM